MRKLVGAPHHEFGGGCGRLVLDAGLNARQFEHVPSAGDDQVHRPDRPRDADSTEWDAERIRRGLPVGGAPRRRAHINASGGLLGRKLKIVTGDTKSDIPNTENVALKVIAKGANFILPSVDYDYGGPSGRAALSKCLISITETGDPHFGYQGIGPLAYNLEPADATEAGALATWAHSKGYKQPYLLDDTTLTYATTMAQFFGEAWKHITGGSVPTDTFNTSDTSIAAQITRLKASLPKPDVIVLLSFQPDQTSALRQIRAAGITTPALGSTTFEGTSWLKGVGSADPNVYAASIGINGPNEPDATVKSVLAEYTKQSGKPEDLPTELLDGYGAVQTIAAAVRRAHSTSTRAVQKALNSFTNVNIPGLGPTTYTPTCHLPVGRTYLMVKPALSGVQYLGKVTPTYTPPHIC